MPSTNRTPSVASHSTMSEPDDFVAGSSHYSLSRALKVRKSEYVRPHRIRVKVGSWNVAACPGTDKDLASWFVDGKGLEPRLDANLAGLSLKEDGDEGGSQTNNVPKSKPNNHAADGDTPPSENSPLEDANQDGGQSVRLVGGSDIGLYVLGLQEIVSLNLVTQSLYTDPTVVSKWQAALEAALPKDYTLVSSQQLSGLLILIYASPEVAATVSNVSTVSVGTGVMAPWGYMGNKGGISSRIVLGEETRMVFTNCHLASGHEQTYLDRRCWDYNRILSQTQFSPVSNGGVMEEEGDKFGDEDFAFWFGDLNFRLDGLPGDDIRRLLMLHTRGEYDLNKKAASKRLDEEGVIVMRSNDSGDGSSSESETPGVSRETSFSTEEEDLELPDPDDFLDPHDDPASLQATLDSLLPHDQLQRIIRQRKAFHEGWQEGPITFLPSYKYDVGTVGLFDSSEKRRAPSWCDRILFRTKRDYERFNQKIQDEIEARKKDEDMKERGIDTAADDESVLFDYDPDKDSSANDLTNGGDGSYDYDEYDEGGDNEDGATVTKEGCQDRVSLDIYTTHQRITSSDHKPIVALFSLDYDAVVPDLKAKVHAEVVRELDRAENEGRPAITLVVERRESSAPGDQRDGDRQDVTDGSAGIDFGGVGFMRPYQRFLTVANTGRVPATVSFAPKPETQSSSESDGMSHTAGPEWLEVALRYTEDRPAEGEFRKPKLDKTVTLQPGETATAQLSIRVTSLSQLKSLNEGTASLADVLVLRVEDGRDYFLPVHATWLPSCFGRSLEELIRVPARSGGVRGFFEKAQAGNKDGEGERWTGGTIPYSLPTHASSPLELYKLTEAIESLTDRAIAEENMLGNDHSKLPRGQAGWPFDVKSHSQPNPLSPGGAQPEDNVEDEDWDNYEGALVEALDTDANLMDAFPPDLPALIRLQIAASATVLFLRSLADGIIPAPLWAKIEAAVPTLSAATSTKTGQQIENDKSAVLDVLSGAPYHNISFVFVTAMLAKVGAELLPLSPVEVHALSTDPGRAAQAATKRSSVRKSLSFRRGGGGAGLAIPQGVDDDNIRRRLAWERRVGEIMGPAVCRTGSSTEGSTPKERRAVEERMAGVVEIFLRKEAG